MVKVAQIHEVPDGGVKRVLVKRKPIAIFNIGGQIYAISDTCSHAEASLAEGEINTENCTVACPLHGAIFSIKTGDALTLPAVSPLERYQVTIENESIMLEV